MQTKTLECNCGTYLFLIFDKYKIDHQNRELIIENCPILKCPNCSNKYILSRTRKFLVEQFIEKYMKENKDILDAKKFFNITNKDYIKEDVSFIYDPWDYNFIPGLYRPYNTGFLTPVFFNIEVLLKYTQDPKYSLELGANTYGNIYKKNQGHLISFGINRNGKVIMWLGDIQNLNSEEQYYLRSENIESDHDIASEFYEGQIEVKWAEPSNDKKLFKKRLRFAEKILNKYNISLSHLEPESIQEASKIVRPLVNTEKAFANVIIPLNKVLVESINSKELKDDIKIIDPECDIENLGSLKLFELWLAKRLEIPNSSKIVSPLFVLYDLRIAFSHLQSKEKKENRISYSCKRLGLSKGNGDFIEIYDVLINELVNMYDNLLTSI